MSISAERVERSQYAVQKIDPDMPGAIARDYALAVLEADAPEISAAELRGKREGLDVITALIDALTGLESAYREGEAIPYARMEARSALKLGRDFARAAELPADPRDSAQRGGE
jgi:anti-sigma-K factor RskA